MQLAYHYLRLRSYFEEEQEGRQIPVSLHQLADILCCTNRNANLILKRMIDSRWIAWSSGRGRGNLSQITFLVPKESLLLDTATELVQRGDIRQSLELLSQEEVSPEFMKQFINWLNSQFGYRSEEKEKQQLEILRLPLSKKRWELDPAYVLFSNEAHFTRQIFDCLTRFNPLTKQIEPQLAHFWEVNENRTEWTFYLRKGVLFHHRRTLTASDVVFSLQRVMNAEPPSPFRWMFSGIEEFKTLGSHVLKIKLREPNHLFLHVLSAHAASILPQDMFKKLGSDFSRIPVGTGPFQVITHDNATLVLDAFTDYFQERAHLDRVEIWLIPDLEQYQPELSTDAFQMRYLAGPSAEGISTDWQETERLQSGCQFISINLSKPGPQQHPLFRKALRHGIDRGKLVSDQENTIIASRLFPHYEETDQQTDYDPGRARELLHEAGYRGEPLRLSTFPHHEKGALVIQDQCKQIGIHLDIELQTLEDFITMQEARTAHMALCDVVFDEDEIFSFMEFFYTEQNFIQCYLHPELLTVVESQVSKSLREPDRSLQLDGFLQLEQQLIDLGSFFPLSRRKQKTYFHSAVKGVSPRSYGWIDFKDSWFDPEHRE